MTLIKSKFSIASCLCAVVLLTGCSGGDARPDSTVRGTVRLDGQPLSEGSVQFTSTKSGESAYANLDGEGHYSITFPATDLETVYEVTVQPPVDEEQDALALMENPEKKKKSSIPKKYSNRTTSDLKVDGLVSGTNEFDFDIVSQ